MRIRSGRRAAIGSAAFLLVAFAVLAPAASSAHSGGAARCGSSQLRISLAYLSPGLSHGGNVIRFRNEGATCSLRGYPGVDGLAANGRVVVHATRTLRGYLGGARKIRTITLRDGQVASATFEGLDTTITGRPCHAYRFLKITPPNGTHSVRLRPPGSFCYPEIHPVVAGKTGRDLGS